MGRSHRPLQHAVQNRNKPSIPEMIRIEIDAICPHLRVVHSSEAKAIGKVANLRPSGRSGRGAAKNSRASARNMMRLQAPLFFPFFSGKTEKNGPAERQLRCHRERGSPVKPDKRADVHPHGVGRIRSPPSSLTAALAIGPYGRREFWHSRKSKPPEAQLRPRRKFGTSGAKRPRCRASRPFRTHPTGSVCI